LGLALVRNLREARSPQTDEEITDFEVDVMAGFVLARSSAGVGDATIRSETTNLELVRDWYGRPLWGLQPSDADEYFGKVLRSVKPATRTRRAGALTVYFQYLELRHVVEIHNLTGQPVECPLDEMNRPPATVHGLIRVPPSEDEMEHLFTGWREDLVTCRKFASVARNYAVARISAGSANSTSVTAKERADGAPSRGWCRLSTARTPTCVGTSRTSGASLMAILTGRELKAIARPHNKDVTIVTDLREVGVLATLPEGRLLTEAVDIDRWHAAGREFVLQGKWEAFPLAERSAQFRERVRNAIKVIVDLHKAGRIVVACHGGVINAYLAEILGLERDYFVRTAHSSVTRIHATPKTQVLWSVNETCHLTGDLWTA
jgi:hypothetical protein